MRGVWAALAAVHVWPFVVVTSRLALQPSLGDAVSFAALAVVLALFALKAANCRYLRTSRPGVELVAWVLCAALVHPGPTGDRVLSEAPPETVVVAAAGTALLNRRLRRRVGDCCGGLLGHLRRAWRAVAWAMGVLGVLGVPGLTRARPEPPEASVAVWSWWVAGLFAARPPPAALHPCLRDSVPGRSLAAFPG